MKRTIYFLLLAGILTLLFNLQCKAGGYIVNDDKPEPFQYSYFAEYGIHECFMPGTADIMQDIKGNPVTVVSLSTTLNNNGIYGFLFKFNTTDILLKSLLPPEKNKMYEEYFCIKLSDGEKLIFKGTIDYEVKSVNNFSYTSIYIKMGTEYFPLIKSNKSSLESYSIKQLNEYAMKRLCESSIESIVFGTLFNVEHGGTECIRFNSFHTQPTFKAMRDKLMAMKGQG